MSGIPDSPAGPWHRGHLVWAALAVLAWMALLVRQGVDAGGVLDVDVVNFGLAAERFDILDRQPQPPGYIGYVLFLRLLHLIAPGLEPVELAKWGARLCGMLIPLVAYRVCRELLAERDPEAFGRPLAAAGLAVVHPLLWYYGADGQSHAAEAFATLLLFAITLRVVRRPSTGRLLLAVAAFGLAGALRPTIPLLSSPLLVWLFWGRPLRDWLLALVTGVASVAVWAAPLVAVSGGWDVYRRANQALVGDLFIANFSLFGSRAHPVLVVANIVRTLWWGAVALYPLCACWPARAHQEERRRWRRAWFTMVALNLLFYALVYAGEAGYLAAAAGLACVLPAWWPAGVGPGKRARIALAGLAGPAFFLFGPSAAPVPNHPDAALPTLAHAIEVQETQAIYQAAVCRAARGGRAVLLTDNASNTDTRRIPLLCPNIAVALYVRAMPFDAGRLIDAWMIFFPDGIMAVPTGIPLEPGPPAHVQLPEPVDRSILAPDSGDELKKLVAARRRCDAETYVDPESGLELTTYAARCLPALRTPTHTIDFTAPARPDAPRFGGL